LNGKLDSRNSVIGRVFAATNRRRGGVCPLRRHAGHTLRNFRLEPKKQKQAATVFFAKIIFRSPPLITSVCAQAVLF
jgi:hypothetical protein